ncbi:MAG: hypothetical protein LBQ82_06220 [Treponema sp.]|jgi:hypothetical protein|nr:hypothetical protein [Treponema sp.]
MLKCFRKVIVFLSIIFVSIIISGCIRYEYLPIYSDLAVRVSPAVIVDLTTQQYIEKTFVVEPSYEGLHAIWMDLDFSYKYNVDDPVNIYKLKNSVIIKIFKDNEMIFLDNNINIFETFRRINDFSKQEDNAFNIKFAGFYGGVNLESAIEYKITVETFFGDNLLEMRKCILRLDKRE